MYEMKFQKNIKLISQEIEQVNHGMDIELESLGSRNVIPCNKDQDSPCTFCFYLFIF